jgi:hypothetical protein
MYEYISKQKLKQRDILNIHLVVIQYSVSKKICRSAGVRGKSIFTVNQVKFTPRVSTVLRICTDGLFASACRE